MRRSLKESFHLLRESLVVVLLVLTTAACSPAQDQVTPPGANCYQTRFQPGAGTGDLTNAYLLMYANFFCYGDRLNAANFDQFQVKYREKFLPLGMTEFDFINLRRKTGDTQVVVMSNSRLAIVAFRGSEATSGNTYSLSKIAYDWVLTDFNFFKKSVPEWGKGVKVHRGFFIAQDIVYSQLKGLVQKHLAGGDRKLWVTGHSLGAGLAPMVALRLAQDGIPVQGLSVFAGPRLGNQAFVDALVSRVPCHERWVDDHDLVTMLPFPWLNFRHFCKPNNLYSDGHFVIADKAFSGMGKVSTHSPGMYLQRLYDVIPQEAKDAVPAPPAFQGSNPDTPIDAVLEKNFQEQRARQVFLKNLIIED